MSVRVMAWVFDQAPTTSAIDQLVLLAIADRANDEGCEAYPSHESMAKKTRLGRETVLRATKRLTRVRCEECKAPLLTVLRGQGRRGTHRYEIGMCDCRSHVTRNHRCVAVTPPCDSDAPKVCASVTSACDFQSHDPLGTSVEPSGTSEEDLLVADAVRPRPEDLQAAWNELTDPPIPRCQALDATRRRNADARLRERGLDGMREVFARVNALAFCRGENDHGWRASFDWALKPGSITKLLEGAYDGSRHRARTPGRTGAPPAGTYDVVMES